jgi:hypothetical protein
LLGFDTGLIGGTVQSFVLGSWHRAHLPENSATPAENVAVAVS